MKKTPNSKEELNTTIPSGSTVGFQVITFPETTIFGSELGANQASGQVVFPQQVNSLEAVENYPGRSITFQDENFSLGNNMGKEIATPNTLLNAEHSSNEELGVNVTGEHSGNTGNISE